MAVIRASLRDFRATMQALGARADKAVNAGLLSTALRARVIMVQETQEKRVMNIGTYQRGWKADVLKTERAVKVYNLTPYAGVIEKGRRAGARQPPSEPLARWAQRKLGLPYKRARSVGFLIARAIKRRGIPGKFVLRDAIPKLEAAFETEMTRELRRALGGP